MEKYIVSEEKKIKLQIEVRCFNCKSSEKPLQKYVTQSVQRYDNYTYDLLFCQECLEKVKPILDILDYEKGE